MGLDMYLYKVEKANIKHGFLIDSRTETVPDDITLLYEEDLATLPEVMSSKLVKGSMKELCCDIDAVMAKIFEGIAPKNIYLKQVGYHYSYSETMFDYNVRIEEDIPKQRDNGNYVLADDGKLCVSYDYEYRPDSSDYNIKVRYKELVEDSIWNYTGPYVTEVENVVYAITLSEVDYQRKGLTDEGFSLLPENTVYVDDKSVVERLCKQGLRESFLENWVDGETVFWAWW